MKKLVLVVLVLVLVVGVSAVAKEKAAAKGTTVNGWVSDMKCGAKGAGPGHEGCAKKCLGEGEKMAFVTDADKKVLSVDNPDALKGHEGHHVAVTGHVNAAKGSVHVESVSMIASADAGKKDSMKKSE